MNKQLAIIKTHSNVAWIVGDQAFDANGNQVQYNDAAVQAYIDAHAYIEKRKQEYPPITDYIDGVVKGDQAQIDAYITACLAVKAKYPKPTVE